MTALGRNGPAGSTEAADRGILSLQPAFVEGIERDGKRFRDMEAAYRHIFRRNLEMGVLLWSAIPVPITYTGDLPAFVHPLVDLLDFVLRGSAGESESFELEGETLAASWEAAVQDDDVSVDARWRRVPGGYEAALEAVGGIVMARSEFLSEWKLVLEQLVKAFDDAGAKLTDRSARSRLARLRQLEAEIPERGRYYRYRVD